MAQWIIVIILLLVFFPSLIFGGLALAIPILIFAFLIGGIAFFIFNVSENKKNKNEEENYKNQIEELKETISVEKLEKEVSENISDYFSVDNLEEFTMKNLSERKNKLSENIEKIIREKAKYKMSRKEDSEYKLEYFSMKIYDKDINLCKAKKNVLHAEIIKRWENKKIN